MVDFNQIPSCPGQQRCQMPGVCLGRGGGGWSLDLTDTMYIHVTEINSFPLSQNSISDFDS